MSLSATPSRDAPPPSRPPLRLHRPYCRWTCLRPVILHSSTMGSSSGLVDGFDFDQGLEFQDEVRRLFRSPVHHTFPTPEGSFFLLVKFRHFLFRLTEESVVLALQSCLGGRSLEFHVSFLSNNHFRISVFSKQVGFHIYKLWRITTSSFDCYFHLWNNGTPH